MKALFLNPSLVRLHELIKRKQTGTPAQLAQRMGCSESTVYNKIKQLRETNLPVKYCATLGSYYYEEEVSFDFCLRVGNQELTKIVGGTAAQQNLTHYLQNKLPTPDYLEYEAEPLLWHYGKGRYKP